MAGFDVGDTIGGIFGGIASGGLGAIVGLFGSIVNGFADAAKDKRRYKHAEEMAKIDLKSMEKEAELNIKREQIVAEGYVDKAIASSRSESIRAGDVGDGIFGLIERMINHGGVMAFFGGLGAIQMAQAYFIVKLIRPAIAVYLIWIFHQQWTSLSGIAKTGEIDEATAFLYMLQVSAFLLCMVCSYYYHERNRIKAPEMIGTRPTKNKPKGGSIEDLDLDKPPVDIDTDRYKDE